MMLPVSSAAGNASGIGASPRPRTPYLYSSLKGGVSLSEAAMRAGHPTEGVFMKCWRCQQTRHLEYDGNGGLRCPGCYETLIPLEGPGSLHGSPNRRAS